jgi:hypothetical protein
MLVRERIESRSAPIHPEEVAFHPHSFADDAGRLFFCDGELRRGINSRHTPFFARLFADGVIQSLIERGLLIDTEPTDLVMDGYGMVLRHRIVPFVSYPNEWCAAMLKDGALTILDLAIELAERGLTLKDAHPWNLLFDDWKPVYVDLTSITPQKDGTGWPAYDEFCRFCYYPLILMSHGQERIARVLLPEYEGILRRDLLTMMRGSAPSRFILSRLLNRGLRSVQAAFGSRPEGRRTALAFLKQARRDLEKVRPPTYQGRLKTEAMPSPSPGSDWTPQQRALNDILAELRPASVLDLSRGAAWSSTLPSAWGYKVVSIGADPSRATAIYETAREKRLPILPLIVDFVKPTPSVGYSDHYSIAATERLKCDMVLALGFANQVASENHFNLDLIAEGLSAFSKRWLVVEFVEGDGGSAPLTLDGFIDALRKRFKGVRVVRPGAGPGVLLLCEK